MIAKTVLIADDTAFVRDRFGVVLTEAGHRAVLVGSVSDLLEAAAPDSAPVDLLMLDLRLPQSHEALPHEAQSHGVELVRTLRQKGARFPILVFSGTIATAQEVRELTTLGVAGFINEYSAPPHILPAIAPHLFPDSFNRRSSPRVPLAITVSYRVDDAIASAVCANVSKGGVFLRTLNPQRAGKRLRVRFRLPGSKREIDADAVVAWSDARSGMGVQFVSLGPDEQTELDEFVNRSARRQ